MSPVGEKTTIDTVVETRKSLANAELNVANYSLSELKKSVLSIAGAAISGRYLDKYETPSLRADELRLITIKDRILPLISVRERGQEVSFDAIILPDGNLHRVDIQDNQFVITFDSEPDQANSSSPLFSRIENPPSTISLMRIYTPKDSSDPDKSSLLLKEGSLSDYELDTYPQLWTLQDLTTDIEAPSPKQRIRDIDTIKMNLFINFGL